MSSSGATKNVSDATAGLIDEEGLAAQDLLAHVEKSA